MPPTAKPNRMPFVPDARASLNDTLLDDTRNLWARAVSGGDALTQAEVDLLAVCIGPFLDELAQRRAAMSVIETAVRPGTVIAFERPVQP